MWCGTGHEGSQSVLWAPSASKEAQGAHSLCRCSAYPAIVQAVARAADAPGTASPAGGPAGSGSASEEAAA